MGKTFSFRFLNSCFDNRTPALSPSIPLRINSVEGSKTCPAFDKLRPRACRGEPCRRIQKRPRRRKWGELFAIVVALTVCGARAEAQQPTKIPRIGYLSGASTPARIEAFRKGLRELGYVEGKEYLHRAPGARGRSSASQGRRDRHAWCDIDPCRQGSNFYDSHYHGAGSRSHWKRVRRQPCATRREHYWLIKP